jgi:predicted HTH transcriptional regulator
MTDDAFQIIVERGRENRDTEFKVGGSILDVHLLRRVIRAVLGMTNNRDGGVVVLGVSERIGNAVFEGMSEEDATSWTNDSFGDKAAAWVDPAVLVDIGIKVYDGRHFVVIEVAEFEESPVFARKDYRTPKGDMVLREGALYVRGTHKPETVEIRTSLEMRRLLDLALQRRLDRFFQLTSVAGYPPLQPADPTDDQRFAEQLQDFLP